MYYSRTINKVAGDPVDINLCHVKVRATWMSPFMEEVRDQRWLRVQFYPEPKIITKKRQLFPTNSSDLCRAYFGIRNTVKY